MREKGFRDLTPITPGMFGYSVIRNSVHADFYHDLLDSMADFGCPLEGLHTEDHALDPASGAAQAAAPGDRPAAH